MDRANPLFQADYEDWKKNLWGCLRAFVAGFIAVLAAHLMGVNGDNIMNTEWWLHVVLVSSLVGGIVGLGKYLRDLFPESTIMQRLPF